MKKHIAESIWNYQQDGKKVVLGYKTLCGKRATTIEEATSKGFQAGVSPENPDACKACQQVAANNRYWKEYRQSKSMKRTI